MRKIFWLIVLCLFLTGCQEDSTGTGITTMPRQEINNPISTRRVLILTKKHDYSLNFLEQLNKQAGRYYSVLIDDLNNINVHNFSFFNAVLIIEFLNNGSAPVLDHYMSIYDGTNNIVLHGLDGDYTSPYPVSVVTANTDITKDELLDAVDQVYKYLRSK